MLKKLINKETSPIRADLLLALSYPEYSRSALSKLFKNHKIFDNHGNIVKSGDKISNNHSIKVDISQLKKPMEEIDLPIIYEDKNIIVIDKPSGVLSHANSSINPEASVASFIRNKVDGLEGERAGIVHRLDRATSGVIICAKNSESLKQLQKQFSSRNVKKTYYAVVNGTLNKDAIEIDIPIARDKKNPKKFSPNISGKAALTKVTFVKKIGKNSLVKLEPLTGRTHQLRVHLKHINHPIVGDELYNNESYGRLLLHANRLEVKLPNGKNMVFESNIPKEFNYG